MHFSLVLAHVILLAIFPTALQAKTIFVDETNDSAVEPFQTWGTAASNLQDALAIALPGDQVWVAKGIYYPDEGGFQTEDGRSSTFRLRNGIGIYGGFTGSETLLVSADPAANPTILSGEIQQDADSTNNAYHVVSAFTADASAILQGFTIQDGSANVIAAGFDSRGGGLNCFRASPTITNCLFLNNNATTLGGAVYNKDSSSPTFKNCSFKANQAAIGGAIANDESSSPVLVNVEFMGNKASQNGGALYSNSSSPTLSNCSFAGNQAGQSGGAVYNANSAFPTFINCIIWKNQASGLTNTQAASVFNDGTGVITFSRCLVENYTAAILSDGGPNLNFNSTDPFFITTPDPSTAPTIAGNLRLGWNSPALDKGSNPSPADPLARDLAGNARILNDTIDLGAYEGPHYQILSWVLDSPVEVDDSSLSVTLTLREGTLPDGWEDAIQANFTGDVQEYSISVTGPGPVYTITLNGITGDGSFTIGFLKPTLEAKGFYLAGVTQSESIQRLSSTSPHHYVVSGNPESFPPYDSWSNAAANLQDALELAAPGDEIWVAKGTYYPDESESQTQADDRTATFQLKNGVKIYGGFAGSETKLAEAKPDANPTILSGDIGIEADASDNSYHIVTADSVDESARLQGFIIRGGNADGPSPFSNGAGLYCDHASPTINNCAFQLNRAKDSGGAIYNASSSPVLTNCSLQGNQTDSRGGAMSNFKSSPLLVNCTFQGNKANNQGGAIDNIDSTPSLENCIIWKNQSNGFTNTPDASISNDGSSTPIYSYCLVENYSKATLDAGVSPSTNLTPTDPLFIFSTDPSTAPFTFGNIRLRVDSPALDVGDNAANTTTSDLAGNKRIINETIDLGSYEGSSFTINIWRKPATIAMDATSFNLEIELDYEVDEIPQALLDSLVQSTTGFAKYTGVTTSGSGFFHTLSFNGLSGEGPLTVAVKLDLAKESGIHFIGESSSVELKSSATKVHYVNTANTNSRAPYDTWATAANHLQDALYWAVSGDQIWVAKGTYYPDEGDGRIDNDREETFELKSGVDIYGGFVGGEAELSEADLKENITLLSGEIQQDGVLSNNSYHVVTVRNTNGSDQPLLKGIDIASGYADGLDSLKNERGAGLYCLDASPQLIDCWFYDNFAKRGGAVFNELKSAPFFQGTNILGNSAEQGGAIYNAAGSSPEFVNCAFEENKADLAGGAIYNLGGPLPDQIVAPKFTNCTFMGNRADGFGGGAIYNDGAKPALVNCTVQGNRAGEFKGAIHNTGNSSPTLTNCIVWGNDIDGQGVSADTSIFSEEGSTATFRHCLVEFYEKTALDAGVTGRNNLAPSDPRFLQPADANKAPTNGGNLGLKIGSPAIDAGSKPSPLVPDAEDLSGNPRILNGTIDLGAIEGAHIEVLSWDPPDPFPTAAEELVVRLSLRGISPNLEALKRAITTTVGGSVNFDQSGPAVTNPTPEAFLLKHTGLSGEGPISLSLDSEKAAAEGLIFVGDDSIQMILRAINATPTHYVNAANTTGEAPYDTWEKAAANLQNALAYAATGDEVWVAQGTYYPDQGEAQTAGDRTASFQLQNGVAIYGGFAGGETGLFAADPFANETILSGNIDQDVFNTDNDSYHVVTAESTDETAQLHGFTITAGNAYDLEDNKTASGGGLYCKDASPTLSFCLFQSNRARDGGAIYNEKSSPKLTNCLFRGNAATAGGAITNRESSPILTNCSFQANKAFDWGGAIYNRISSPTFINCSFQGNNADLNGGAIFNREKSAPTFTNCIVWNNAESGETDTQIASVDNDDGNGNPGDESIPIFSFCLVENYSKSELDNSGASPDTNFEPVDPLFVLPSDPALAPLTLVSDSGAQPSLRLQFGSPALDKGSIPNPVTSTDPAGNPRISNDRIDLGAYEGPVFEIESWVLSDPLEPGDTSLELTLTLKNGGKLPSGWQNTLQVRKNGTADFASIQDFGAGPAYFIILSGLTGNGQLSLAFDESLTTAAGFAFNENLSFQAILRSDTGGSNIHVNADTPSSAAPYDTWETAATKLQDALDYALPGDTVMVAKGTYYPDEGENQTDGNRTARFNLKSGVAIYGGFKGGEEHPSEADPERNLTILSGDIDQDGVANANNSYHVVLANATEPTAILDGFIITSGFADDPFSDNAGGGLYCKEGASPTISNCWFEGNFALFGGAIGNKASMPIIIDCTFRSNFALIHGGAIRNILSSSPTITNCSFEGNQALENGGALYNDSSDPVLTNCALQGNAANKHGGAVFNNDSSPIFINCSLQGNRALFTAGAIGKGDQDASPFTLKNCIIWDNQAFGTTSRRGSSLDTPAGSNSTTGGTFFNSLVENFSKFELDEYSDGTNSNLVYADPRFYREANPASAPTTSGNLQLTFGSQAIDAGENDYNLESKDLAGNDRVLDSVIDLGAYEGGVDPERPIITLTGKAAITLPFNTTWIDPSAIVTDNVDSDLTVQIGGDTVDPLRFGDTFTITYTVTDSDGNSAIQLTRTVTIGGPIPPAVITLSGSILTWSPGRVLQTSDDMVIWTDLPNAKSPLTISNSDPKRFWRLRDAD